MAHLVNKDSLELVEGLGMPVTLAEGTDLNDVVKSGVYILPDLRLSGGEIKNVPWVETETSRRAVAYENSVLLVAGTETATNQVMIIAEDTKVAMAVRVKLSYDAWGAWRLVAGLS